MNLVNGATYRFMNRADQLRSLNVYGNSPSNLANVCLWKSDNDDICQQWVYVEQGSHAYLKCKGNGNLVLDRYTGSVGGNKVVDFNAHVYNEVSDTSYIVVEDAPGDGNYVRIRLEDEVYLDSVDVPGYYTMYLTANQGSNGSSGGKDLNAAGNVYFYHKELGDKSQDWLPIRLDGGTDPDPEPEPEPEPEEVVVTGMPSCWAYSSDKEYFHPSSGMVPGDFMTKNNGKAILTKIHDFYEKVFNTTLKYEDDEGNEDEEANKVDSRQNMDKYGYSLYGSRTVGNGIFNGTYHLGVDMTRWHGAPVYSAHAGELLYAGGNRIAIYDPVKNVTYLYLHTDIDSSIAGCGSDFDDPVNITVGQLLGTQSDVGLGNGNDHLHFEVKKGRDSATEMPTDDLDDSVIGLYEIPYDYM